MNLFARILSHGFALALVALLAIGLIYRGELFPGVELPDYLSFGSSGDSHVTADSGSTGQQGAAVPGDGVAAAPEPGPDAGEAAMAAVETAPVAGSPDAGMLGSDESGPEDTAPVATTGAGEDTAPMMPAPAADALPEAPAEAMSLPAEMAGTQQPASAGDEQGGLRAADEMQAPLAADEVAVPAAADEMQAPLATDEVEPPAAADEMQVPLAADEIEAPRAVDEMESARPVTEDLAAGEQQGGAEVAEAAQEAAGGAPQAPAATGEPAMQAVEAGTEEQTSAYRLLAAAREAYWLRDYEQAEQHYRALIALDPDNPDGYGELGNMYFSQGDWEQAATSYYEAGVRLVDQGLVDHAMQLVDVIRGLNGEQAGQLEQKIMSSISAAGSEQGSGGAGE